LLGSGVDSPRGPAAVDKSHLITIGERLYSQSIELIRELVNNAYGADATRVGVTLGSDSIVVEDDGSGMDLDGLKQYFNIGSQEKLQNPLSSRFQRVRVGQFGIGKFASLAACRRFEVTTQKGDFVARVEPTHLRTPRRAAADAGDRADEGPREPP
jgi:HSP90 family molecular chaperone